MTLPVVLSGIFRQRQKTYKMVLILAMLEAVDETGKARVDSVRSLFLDFYQDRESKGLPVDVPSAGMRSWQEATLGQINDVFDQPLMALQRANVLEGGTRTDTWISFRSDVWNQMDQAVIEELRVHAIQELDDELSKLWAQSYFSLREKFSLFMNRYLSAKTELRKQHEVALLLEQEVPSDLKGLPFVSDTHVVQGSVGRPAWARMPWIAIMDPRVTKRTPRGYYVCYIFSEDMQSVYLTLKCSDEPIRTLGRAAGFDNLRAFMEALRNTSLPRGFQTDDLLDLESEYKDGNYLVGVAAYKRYDLDRLPNDEELFTDLQRLVQHYQQIVDSRYLVNGDTEESVQDEPKQEEPFLAVADDGVKSSLKEIGKFIQAKGFDYPPYLIENFYLSLKTKPFVILAGISGTGKTKLVKLFAEALGANEENSQFTLIPVRPDWSDPSDLVGYTNLAGEFQMGAVSKVLREASLEGNEDKPYFICLDEMNLARVEHYYSDLLSIMETTRWKDGKIVTDRVISFTCSDTGEDVSLHLPENVYLVGTVNMDETTHPFSKKVLDRASTIEFNYIDLNNLAGLDGLESEQPQSKQLHQSFLRTDYLCLQEARDYREIIEPTVQRLVKINNALELIHAHVGFRIRDAVCYYMIYNDRFDLMTPEQAFDFQFTQKILPRVQGSSQAVKKTLVDLLNIATGKRYQPDDTYNDDSELSRLLMATGEREFASFTYPTSARKLAYMLRRLEEDGFTSFWLS